ncbi:Protein saal1 [Quillaja saponaria]|uniref:Protein saal1 n=1 Tax=Quillaja saponaria TaxID=32244 RepID=A0AAD7KY39_QUISA|nr:Protein saal1 [Quillaja saponaria]
MAVRSELALVEEEEEEQQEVYDGPTHHPYAPSDELFEISTTVDPSYIISLVRKLVPSLNFLINEEENEDLCNRLRSGVTVGEEAWEEYGCVLWDLAASKTHAELMVQNLILEVLLANLMISQSARVSEICIGIIGNLACHEVPMKHIVSTNGLIELIVDQLFLDDPQCLCETFRLLTMGLRSNECITWSEALQSEHILCRFLWVAENTMNLQLIEKSIGLILAICESQPKVVDALLPPLMKLGLASLLISLLSFEMSKLMSERIPERYSVLDVILRVIEALSVMDGYSQDICSNKELFQIVCDLVKLPDKVEVANSCVTAAVLIANILSDIADRSSDISQDFSFLQGLLDIFPFASDDLEARSAVWSIVARLLVRVQENDMSLTSLYHYVSVIVSKTDMIEDDLLHQQLGYSSYEHESLAPSGAKLAARTTSLKRIISILNHWTALKENADVNNVMGEPLVNDVDINRLLECCHKHSK